MIRDTGERNAYRPWRPWRRAACQRRRKGSRRRTTGFRPAWPGSPGSTLTGKRERPHNPVVCPTAVNAQAAQMLRCPRNPVRRNLSISCRRHRTRCNEWKEAPPAGRRCAFLDHLESTRANGARSRNLRWTAIRSFLERYIAAKQHFRVAPCDLLDLDISSPE